MNRTTEKVTSALRELLTDLIDYAGLFPPASLEMSTAVQNYAHYKYGEHAWMLGRFIVPVSRLGGFEAAARSVNARDWRVAVLVSDPISELPHVSEFNERASNIAMVDAIETKLSSVAELDFAAKLVPTIDTYCEIDPSAAADLLPAIRAAGFRAKIRTGGITPTAIPSAQVVSRFILDCVKYDVAFKATAGLHHPVRCFKPLTYETNPPQGRMHGFLNVFAASIFARLGATEGELANILDCDETIAFSFSNDYLEWHDRRATRDQIKDARKTLAISFGSCSFEEPIADLQELGLL